MDIKGKLRAVMDMELAPTPAFRAASKSIAEDDSEDSNDSLNVSVPIRLLRILCIIASVELASIRVNTGLLFFGQSNSKFTFVDQLS